MAGAAPRERQMPWLDRLVLATFNKFARSSLSRGHLSFALPNGETFEFGDLADVLPAVPNAPAWMELPPKQCVVTVHNTDMFFKVIARHDSGLGEAYMAGDFDVDDLGAFMAVVTANARSIETSRGLLGVLNWLGDKLLYLAHLTRANTVEGSKKNISEHYDAGNAMYKLFLDETLTYSAAIHSEGCSLRDAQLAKLDALVAAAAVSADSHVLEVGCGWGSCAIRAVQQTGCRWTGITVSQEQLVEAQARVEAAGVADRVTLLFCDYRDVPRRFGAASFDAVISCEMIEAVGHEHLPTYFSVVGTCLKPGGLFAMQVITMPDERYEGYCKSSDFIREHIFPGGHLPSMGAMTACATTSGLTAVGLRDIGPDYALSLRAWRANWSAQWGAIRKLGYPESWLRKWEFYFAYCEAAFDCSYIQDYQITWRRTAEPTCGSVTSPAPGAARTLPASGELDSPSTTASDSDGNRKSMATTWALFGVYCVLAGIVIARQPRMLTALLSFAAAQGLHQVIHMATPMLVPSMASQPALKQAAWLLDCAEAIWAAPLGLVSCTMLLSSQSWLQALQRGEHAVAPLFLVCAATGLWASHLAALVQSKLFQERPRSVLHSVLLLTIFGAAAFKQEHTGLLVMTLPALLCSVPNLALEYSAHLGISEQRRAQLASLHVAARLCLQHVLHAAILVIVLSTPHIWSSPVFYLLASNSMLYICYHNLCLFANAPEGRCLRATIRRALPGSSPKATHIKVCAYAE